MTISDLTNIETFKTTLGFSEGGGNYKAVYPKGATPEAAKALGKYQFIPARIKDVANFLEVPQPTPAEFINDKDLQEKFFIGHVGLMLQELSNNGSLQYIGTTVKGANKYPVTIPANIYGLLGGAHLAGAGGVIKFFTTGKDSTDALGTHTSDYIAKFSDKVSFIDKAIQTINETVKDVLNGAPLDNSLNFWDVFILIAGIGVFYFVFKA